MKARLLLCFFILVVSRSMAALAGTAIWEVDAGGATANAGYFNPANANFPTDATATSATGNAPVISSATYNFVAGDVGAWVYIKSGTNWLPGWYKISSVASNAATVDATIGHGITLTSGVYALTTVAGVASTASPTGGTYGVDYSQQAAAKLSLTDLVSTGSSTTITSATAGFTPVMVGNGLHLTTTGTGAFGIIGWYELVSYTNTTTMVTDQTTNNGTALAAGTCAIGGAIKTLGAIGSATTRLGAVAGNQIWVNGTFSALTTDTFACAGSATNPLRISGYGTRRSDGYLGRNATGNGKLVTTNMPAYAYGAAKFNSTGSFILMENMQVSGSISGPTIDTSGGSGNSAFTQCVITNSSTNTAAQGLNLDGGCRAYNCDVFMTGASGGATGCGISLQANAAQASRCRVQCTSVSIPCVLINATYTVCANNVLIGGIRGVSQALTSAVPYIADNTITGAVDGINVVTGATNINSVTNNIITDNSGYGLNGVSAANAVFSAYNRFRDNTVGNINLATNWIAATNYGAVTSGNGTSDYVNAGSGDYRLLSTSPAANASLFYSSSMGALQRNSTTSSAESTYGAAQ